MPDTGRTSRLLLLGWEGALQPAFGRAIDDSQRAAAVFRSQLDAALARVQAAGGEFPTCSAEGLLSPLLHRLMAVAAGAYCRSEGPVDVAIAGIDCADLLQTSSYLKLAELVTEEWVQATLLLLARLRKDEARLADWLGVARLSAIESLAAAGSDVHDVGGSSIRIVFADGHCIFYKPRPVTGELFWHELTERTASIDSTCRVRAARVLQDEACCGYGWMEEIRTIRSDQVLSSSNYWRSAGSLLCHAWITHMTDLHMANVVATADGPTVVDAECLGTPDVPIEHGGEAPLWMELARTGLLPAREEVFLNGSVADIPDVSGFFGRSGPVAGIEIPVWDFKENGRSVLSFTNVSLKEQSNRSGNDSPIACLDSLVDGFMRAARVCIRLREELLTDGGWLERMQHAHAPRIVLHSTLSYALRMSEWLAEGNWAEVDDTGIARGERAILERLCVPRFFLPPGSCDLIADGGGIVDRAMFQSPGGACIRTRLQRLSVADLEARIKVALLFNLLRNQEA